MTAIKQYDRQQIAQIKIDSVFFRDSVFFKQKDDTVFLTRKIYSDKFHNDTIREIDTVRIDKENTVIKKEIIKKTDWKKSITIAIVISICLIVISKAIKLYLKKVIK